MKNILVVGCNGGMGKAICTHLVQKQFAVVGIDVPGETNDNYGGLILKDDEAF